MEEEAKLKDLFLNDSLKNSFEDFWEEMLIYKNSKTVLEQILEWNYKLGDPIS